MASEGVLATLHAAWRALLPLDAPMAVIGGLALSAWNHARFTRDADILVSIDPSRLEAAITALRAGGFHPKHSPATLTVDGQTIVQFTHLPESALLPFQFDLLVANSDFQRDAIGRGVERSIPGGDARIRIVRPDDLVILKLAAGRMIDLADAAMLLRENRADIDLARVAEQARVLGLVKSLDTVWHEAFPDESLPP